MILTLAEAQAQLPDVIHNLATGAEVAITENNRTVAKLTVPVSDQPRPTSSPSRPPVRGTRSLETAACSPPGAAIQRSCTS